MISQDSGLQTAHLRDMGMLRQAVQGGILYNAVNASIKKDEKSNKAWLIRVITVSS